MKEEKVITFDVWDTLIKRKCHPEEIKKYITTHILITYFNNIKEEEKDEYKLYYKRLKIEDDEYKKNTECNIYTVFERLLDEILIDKKDIKKIVKDLVDKETEREIKVTYVNPDILKILKQYKDNKKYCISDFYMGEKELSKILKHHDLLKYFTKIYSSMDVLKTKRNNGEIFKYFSKVENIDFSNIIHVGDNQISDIDIPKSLGIETIKIENVAKYSLEKDKLKLDLDEIKKLTNEARDKTYNIGVDLAPLAYFFIYDNIKTAHSLGYDKIYYQTREGETFIKFHDLITKDNIFDFKMDSEILEVSRVATFTPSLERIDTGNLLRLWAQYREQSLKSLFKTLNIDIKEYKEKIKEYNLTEDEVIANPQFDFRLWSFLEDEEVSKKLESERVKKKEELIKYFETKISKTDKKIYLTDIGWRGTIQDNIAYIFKDKQIDGYYISLFEYYNYQPKNTRKFALITDKEFLYDTFQYLITFLENCFTPATGSVIGYKDKKAIRKVITNEKAFNEKHISDIQEGMMDGIKKINEYMKYRSVFKEDYTKYIDNILTEIKYKPSKEIVDVYTSIVQNDIFGTGDVISKNKNITFIQKLNPFYIRKRLRDEIWKEIIVKKYNLNFYYAFYKLLSKIKRIIKKEDKK